MLAGICDRLNAIFFLIGDVTVSVGIFSSSLSVDESAEVIFVFSTSIFFFFATLAGCFGSLLCFFGFLVSLIISFELHFLFFELTLPPNVFSLAVKERNKT
jgi:hypothetical protein